MDHAFRALDATHALHPFTDHADMAAGGGARIITGGNGAWLIDDTGAHLFDGMSGLWCVNLGYGRTELADAAHRQMVAMPYYNGFFKTTTEPAIALAARLAAISGMEASFLSSSGSEANDTVVRLARTLWAARGKPSKTIILTRRYGYHGSTLAATSMCGMPLMHAQGGLLPDFHHVEAPYAFDLGVSPEEAGRIALADLERAIATHGADRIAAFVGEPVHGAGGVIIPPATGYWSEVERICRANDILLVSDEVICGFGRLGRWFGYQHYGFRPDMAVFAKGVTSGYIPLSGVLVSADLAAEIRGMGKILHGYTYTGHPVACAVALETIRILEDEHVLERVHRTKAPALKRALETHVLPHRNVGEVRSEGLMAAVELVAAKGSNGRLPGNGITAWRVFEEAFRQRLVTRAVRDSLVLAPTLVASEDEIEEMAKRLRRTLDVVLP